MSKKTKTEKEYEKLNIFYDQYKQCKNVSTFRGTKERMELAAQFGNLELIKALWRECKHDYGNHEIYKVGISTAIIYNHLDIVEYFTTQDYKYVWSNITSFQQKYSKSFDSSDRCIQIAFGKGNYEILQFLREKNLLYFVESSKKYMYEVLAKTCKKLQQLFLPKYLIIEIVEQIAFNQFTTFELYNMF